MNDKIYAVRLKEYNKGAGHLLRNWIGARWKLHFEAGESTPKRPFRPSKIHEVTKEQYDYIMGRSGEGVPNVPQPRSAGVQAFQGWVLDSRQELVDMVNKEADQRASRGVTSARALVILREPMHAAPPVEPAEVVVDKVPEPADHVAEDKTGTFLPIDVKEELSKDKPAERPAPIAPISKREAAKQYKAIKDGKVADPTVEQAHEPTGDDEGDSKSKKVEEKKPKAKKKKIGGSKRKTVKK
ncbi:MAG: hypothetical protein GY841_15355 [FCB group bacterium]|nr:hypothetical protein [FCB group bacterium]